MGIYPYNKERVMRGKYPLEKDKNSYKSITLGFLKGLGTEGGRSTNFISKNIF